MKKKYEVEIARVEYMGKTVVVEAESEEEAEALAKQDTEIPFKTVEAEEFLNGTSLVEDQPKTK